MNGLRIVVLGTVGAIPFAGVAWQALHYLEGFRRLGNEVVYLEDTGAWPYDMSRNSVTDDPTYTVDYLARIMGWWGHPDEWAYRAPDGSLHGAGETAVRTWLRDADVLVNLTGATVLREEHAAIPIRVLVETDPVLPEIEVAQGRRFIIDLLAAHTHLFTFAENLGQPDCGVPTGRFDYRTTRQPIVLDWWAGGGSAEADPAAPLTTIGSWRQSGKDVEWRGETYTWSKHHEFLKFIDLPSRVGVPLELALAFDDPAPIPMLESAGWRVVDAIALSRWIEPYRAYIQHSRGEFTVAKDQNVRLRSGWFSDRSASYLAAGRPVVTQDTGFGVALPTGEGLFAFRSTDEAIAAIEAVAAEPERHRRAAREIAADYFRAETVLGDLLSAATASASGAVQVGQP